MQIGLTFLLFYATNVSRSICKDRTVPRQPLTGVDAALDGRCSTGRQVRIRVGRYAGREPPVAEQVGGGTLQPQARAPSWTGIRPPSPSGCVTSQTNGPPLGEHQRYGSKRKGQQAR